MAIVPRLVSSARDPAAPGDDPGRLDAGEQAGTGSPGSRRVAQGQPGRIGQPVLGAVGRADHAVEVEPGHQLRDILRSEQADVDAEAALHLGGGPERRPRIRVADQEEVAVLDHVERQPVGRAEAGDQGDAGERQLDVDPARELVPEAARAQRPVEPVPRAVSRSTRTTEPAPAAARW